MFVLIGINKEKIKSAIVQQHFDSTNQHTHTSAKHTVRGGGGTSGSKKMARQSNELNVALLLLLLLMFEVHFKQSETEARIRSVGLIIRRLGSPKLN